MEHNKHREEIYKKIKQNRTQNFEEKGPRAKKGVYKVLKMCYNIIEARR